MLLMAQPLNAVKAGREELGWGLEKFKRLYALQLLWKLRRIIMKKNILITLITCLSLISLCFGIILGNTQNGYIVIDDDQAKSTKDTFKLGMNKNEIMELIKSENLELISEYNHGTEGSSIYCEDMRFLFDQQNKAVEIFVYNNPLYVTSKGLAIGDNFDKFEKLYGKKYSSHEEMDATVYQFKFKSNYFSVIVTDGIISGWGIHI